MAAALTRDLARAYEGIPINGRKELHARFGIALPLNVARLGAENRAKVELGSLRLITHKKIMSSSWRRFFTPKPKEDTAQGHAPAEQAGAGFDDLIAAGNRCEDRGEFQAALDLYRSAAALSPDSSRAYMNAGNALRHLEQWEAAIAAHRSAIACDPANAPAHFNLGLSLHDRGHWEGAEAALLEAARLQPDILEVHVLLADVYERQARFADAEAEFIEALALAPANAPTLLNFATYCLRQGRFDQALQLLKKPRVADPA